jgi:hypothetical protein
MPGSPLNGYMARIANVIMAPILIIDDTIPITPPILLERQSSIPATIVKIAIMNHAIPIKPGIIPPNPIKGKMPNAMLPAIRKREPPVPRIPNMKKGWQQR